MQMYGGIRSKNGGPMTEQEEAVHEFMQYLRGGQGPQLEGMLESEGEEDDDEDGLPEGMAGLNDFAKLQMLERI
jgi:hypothetical protein